jgi:hypothetical protein
VRFALTGVEGVEGVLQVRSPDALPAFPEGAEQLNQPDDPFDTATGSIHREIVAPKHKAAARELFETAKIVLPRPC